MSVPKSGTVTIIVITVTQLNPPGTFNIWINRLILSRPFWLTTSSVSREPHGKEARISGVTKMVKKAVGMELPRGTVNAPVQQRLWQMRAAWWEFYIWGAQNSQQQPGCRYSLCFCLFSRPQHSQAYCQPPRGFKVALSLWFCVMTYINHTIHI